MIDLKMMALGGLGAAAVAAFAIWPLAHAQGVRTAEKAAQAEISAHERVGARLLAERDQARAEVEKINAAMAAQIEELARVMSADSAERAAAAARMEKAAQTAAIEARRAGERALAAREVIQNVADQCARAGVPADVVRVLNDIIGPAPMGDGQVPARSGHN